MEFVYLHKRITQEMKLLKILTIILIVLGFVFSYMSLAALVYFCFKVRLSQPNFNPDIAVYFSVGLILFFPISILLLYLMPVQYKMVRKIRMIFLFFWINAMFWAAYSVLYK